MKKIIEFAKMANNKYVAELPENIGVVDSMSGVFLVLKDSEIVDESEEECKQCKNPNLKGVHTCKPKKMEKPYMDLAIYR